MSFGQWLILVILGAAFGASFGFNEILVGAYGPLTVSALRVGLGALGCWVWVLGTGRRVELRGAGLVGVLAFGLFQYGAPFALLPLAQQHVTSSTAGIANAMTPVAVVLISHLWSGGERITAAKLFGVGFGVCGMVLLVAQGAEGGRSEPLFI
ncbi:MAG: DMT family transporter, partial [Paracoccaceae bacterium]